MRTNGQNTNETTVDQCAEEAETRYQVFWIVVISVIVFFNVVILVAMAKSWRVLKQNVVYRYLISCLLSVIAFCLLSAFEILHTMYHAEEKFLSETVLQRFNKSNPLHQAVMRRYAYRKGLLPILAIVMQFNIAVLLYAVSDNTYFVGRCTNVEFLNQVKANDQKTQSSVFRRFWKHHKPIGMCAFSWVIPFALSIPVAFGWNCVEHCRCLPAYRWFSTCIPVNASKKLCSRTWLPASQSFVVVITALYWTATAINFVMLVSTVRKFRKVHAPLESKSVFASSNLSNTSNRTSKTSNIELSQSGEEMRSSDSTGVSQQSVEPTKLKRQASSFFYRRGKPPPLDRTIVLIIVLSISMFISVTPIMCIWLFDVVVDADVSGGIGFPIALSFSYVYAAVMPLILLKYMGGLKKACISFFIKCPCLHQTEVRKLPKPPKATPEVLTGNEPKSQPTM